MGYTITESDILDSANTEYWFDSSVKLISSIPHSDELTGGYFFMWSSAFHPSFVLLKNHLPARNQSVLKRDCSDKETTPTILTADSTYSYAVFWHFRCFFREEESDSQWPKHTPSQHKLSTAQLTVYESLV